MAYAFGGHRHAGHLLTGFGLTEPASKTPFCCGGAVLALAANIDNPKLNPTITATARNRSCTP